MSDTFARPPLADMIQQTRSDLQGRFPGNGAFRRRSVLGVIAAVHALGENSLHARIDWAVRQAFTDTCDDEYVLRKAARYSMSRLAARAASGSIMLTGTDEAAVPVTARWQDDTGLLYAMAAGTFMDGTSTVVTVTCLTAGAAGNLAAGASLSLVNPVSGLDPEAVVQSPGLTGGADQEEIEALRQRVIERERRQPSGGNDSDWMRWAKEAHPDVDRVFISTEMGSNKVSIRFTTKSGPIPDAGLIATVQAYVGDRSRRPTTSDPRVLPLNALPINFTIHLEPDTPETRAAVSAALDEVITREGAPSTRLYKTHLTEATSGAAGEVNHSMTVPGADVVPTYEELPVLGVITWV